MDLALALPTLQRGFASRETDPAVWFKWGLQGDGLKRLREALSLFVADDPIDELHMRACNKGTKTHIKARYVVACAQKREELDGVPIPQWDGPVECMQLVLDYPQQLLSVKAAYEKAVGKWPHHPRKQGSHLTSMHIMPVGGDPNDESGWSPIYFMSMKNLQSGTGARADVIDFDEPPPMEFLHELRKAAHAGRRGIILIGETPIKRRQWAPLLADYGDQPRRSLRRLDYRAEVRWSLDEVADWVLSPKEKDKLRQKYKTDPRPGAREHGDYVNIDGSCPFDGAAGIPSGTIDKMIAAWCRPAQMRRIPIKVEGSDGVVSGEDSVSVEVWVPPSKGLRAYMNIDPASGIDDGQHNPLGLHLSDEDTGELLVRWNGHTAPYSLGSVAAALHRYYNECWCDIEMKDHWGVNVLRGYQDGGGGNLCYEDRELRPGVFSKEVGYDVVAETKAIWVGCIQEWIKAFAAGQPYAPCHSREVFNFLLDMELDADDKVVPPDSGPNHAEDVWLLGQKLRRLNRPRATDPEVYVPGPTDAERQMRNLFGQEDRRRTHGRLLRPALTRPR